MTGPAPVEGPQKPKTAKNLPTIFSRREDPTGGGVSAQNRSPDAERGPSGSVFSPRIDSRGPRGPKTDSRGRKRQQTKSTKNRRRARKRSKIPDSSAGAQKRVGVRGFLPPLPYFRARASATVEQRWPVLGGPAPPSRTCQGRLEVEGRLEVRGSFPPFRPLGGRF